MTPRFFCDHCIPGPVVNFLRELAESASEPEQYLHLLEKWKVDPGDDVWIPEVCGWKGDWVIVTDDRARKDRAVWLACRVPILRVAVGFSNLPLRLQAQKLLHAWDNVLAWARFNPKGISRLQLNGKVVPDRP